MESSSLGSKDKILKISKAQKSELLHRLKPKLTLREIGEKYMISQGLDHNPQVQHILFSTHKYTRMPLMNTITKKSK